MEKYPLKHLAPKISQLCKEDDDREFHRQGPKTWGLDPLEPGPDRIRQGGSRG